MMMVAARSERALTEFFPRRASRMAATASSWRGLLDSARQQVDEVLRLEGLGDGPAGGIFRGECALAIARQKEERHLARGERRGDGSAAFAGEIEIDKEGTACFGLGLAGR